MKRIYHHFEKWEEVKAGMWEIVGEPQRSELLEKAIKFTGNAKLYGSYMRRIIHEWPYSCEQNLSNPSMNRLAWIGHAGCCLALGCPEDITRQAWGFLTEQQRDEANLEALNKLTEWQQIYATNNQQLYKQVV